MNPTGSNQARIEIGPTPELSLRVSVGTLVRLLFHNPDDGRTMLALERTATLRKADGRDTVVVRTKPFGGAARIADADALQKRIGAFRFDSIRSRDESDFRILIEPSAWSRLVLVCRDELGSATDTLLDSSPDREIAEEIEDSLNVTINRDQYESRLCGMAVEARPSPTENVRAPGIPTARIYYLYEAWVTDKDLIAEMHTAGSRYSNDELRRLAQRDAEEAGAGRANAILVSDLEGLRTTYNSIPIRERAGRVRVGGYELESNVVVLLEDVEQLTYQLEST